MIIFKYDKDTYITVHFRHGYFLSPEEVETPQREDYSTEEEFDAAVERQTKRVFRAGSAYANLEEAADALNLHNGRSSRDVQGYRSVKAIISVYDTSGHPESEVTKKFLAGEEPFSQFQGYSLCSPLDMFDRAQGRKIALDRAFDDANAPRKLRKAIWAAIENTGCRIIPSKRFLSRHKSYEYLRDTLNEIATAMTTRA